MNGSLSTGTKLGRYEIRSKIGEGGMGEVYLAEDTQLHRPVALKILPGELAANRDRMRRFEQEATAAAALNHPNIAHIYEIGSQDEIHFIAMEFIEGTTLGQKIHREQTSLTRLLKYLTQVAEGLAKAHSAGIVHRDLKPDNIMISADDYAKVLDFGLAKLVEPQKPWATEAGSSGESATAILAEHSTPGMVMGTIGYMSPEQAQGRVREIDHRSDIFSFGCILYEAATGRKAFNGADTLDSLHKIVHQPTPEIAESNPGAPSDLQRIVRRCLAKEPDKRYHSIKDVAIELDEIGQALKGIDESHYAAQRGSGGDVPSAVGSRRPTHNSWQTAADNTPTEVGRSTSSAEYLATGIRRHKLGVAVAGLALLVATGGIVFAIYKLWQREKPAAPFAQVKITKLTASGKVTQGVLLPDGRQVVYVVNEGGRRSLWLRQIATVSDVPLDTPEDMQFWGMTVSPDGNFLYSAYGVGGRANNRDLYQMSILGGAPKKVIENIDSPVSFSPDGKQFSFVRNHPGESALMVANSDGTAERKVAARTPPNTFGNMFNGAVAWSPDGKRIASIAINFDSAGRFMNVVEVPVGGGEERPINSRRWVQLNRLTWLRDGSGLVMTGMPQPSESDQVWFISYPDGEARKITNDLNNYGSVSVSADGQILMTVQEDLATNIWVAPGGDKSRATQITSSVSGGEGAAGVAWTPDGKIVYHSVVGGVEDLWVMNADGSDRRQLTADDTADRRPAVSSDGRYLVFASESSGLQSIWRMDRDGRNRKQLISSRGNVPQANAEWVVYQMGRRLWKVSIDGGEPIQLGEPNMLSPAVSPDGKLVACSFEPPGAPAKLAILPIEGGPPIKIFEPNLRLPAEIHWSPDGRSITYVSHQNGVSDIWGQSLDGGEPKKLTDFKVSEIFAFDWSRDNKLVVSHGSRFSDVFLIRNVK